MGTPRISDLIIDSSALSGFSGCVDANQTIWGPINSSFMPDVQQCAAAKPSTQGPSSDSGLGGSELVAVALTGSIIGVLLIIGVVVVLLVDSTQGGQAGDKCDSRTAPSRNSSGSSAQSSNAPAAGEGDDRGQC